jgi:hypothetical protein
MNNSTSHNLSTSQPQRTDSNSLGEYFNNGMPSFSNFQSETETPQDDLMWDPSLFTNPQIYSPPVAMHTPAWNQNAAAQSRDPALTAYGGLQSSFQLSQYGQHTFDPRQPSPQPAHDPRLISRPSPSPAQYTNHNAQTAMGYRELSYPNQQQFNPQTMVYQQRPNSTTPNFDSQANRSPYFNYGTQAPGQQHLQVMQPPSLIFATAYLVQGLDLPNNLSGFPDQQQRPAAPFIDPSFLTANNAHPQRPESAQSEYYNSHL